MKTLKELKSECVKFYSEKASIYFSESFNKKMGGTQTITFENDFLPQIKIDKREYYKGRGAKYNNPSMHEHIEVFVTIEKFNKKVNERAKMLFEREKENNIMQKKLNAFCKKYHLSSINYTALYGDSTGLFFEHSKQKEIESELNVNLNDFFSASGKTYFFAKSKIGLLLFYHNNRQSYSFEFANEEKRNEFYSERKKWVNAPYAHLLGQNNNQNLFVC